MGRDMYMHVPNEVVPFISTFALKLVDPENHIFIHGSRRFGYHLSSSETDVTIYMDTKGPCELKEILFLLQDTISLKDLKFHVSNDSSIFLRMIKEEYLDDFLPNEEGITYFHLPLHKVHIRVYSNLNLFIKEKEELDYIEQNITDKEIWNILENRKTGEHYDGKAVIDMLKSNYRYNAISRFKDWGSLLFGCFNRKRKICTD